MYEPTESAVASRAIDNVRYHVRVDPFSAPRLVHFRQIPSFEYRSGALQGGRMQDIGRASAPTRSEPSRIDRLKVDPLRSLDSAKRSFLLTSGTEWRSFKTSD